MKSRLFGGFRWHNYSNVYMISSQPRYDHFDTSPYMFTLKNEGNNHYSIF